MSRSSSKVLIWTPESVVHYIGWPAGVSLNTTLFAVYGAKARGPCLIAGAQRNATFLKCISIMISLQILLGHFYAGYGGNKFSSPLSMYNHDNYWNTLCVRDGLSIPIVQCKHSWESWENGIYLNITIAVMFALDSLVGIQNFKVQKNSSCFSRC